MQAALTQSQATLKSALGSITGQGGFDDGMAGDEFGGDEFGDDMGDEMSDVSVDDSEMTGEEPEEPEVDATAGLGRTAR